MTRTQPEKRSNPFPGLRPFQSDEHHLFFGREDQTAALLQLLRKNRFLAVVGTSGSGKSSLVRAGMIAELHSGTMTQAGSTWEVIILRPGGSPVENLARAFVEADLYDAEDANTLPRLLATLSRSRFGLVEAVKQSDVFQPETNLLVVVDQFEELFRFRQQGVGSEEAAAAFVNLLLTACEQAERPIYVAITMRSDYLGDCSEIPGLAEAVNEGEYLIPRLLRDQKRDAIEKPIGVGGAKISPLLVQRLLNDVGDDPDQLPVLQHALMRMWEVWFAGSDHSRPIDFRDFEATGGLAAALSNHADEIHDSLPDERHRRTCERLFKTLTEKGADNRGIRRPTRLAQLTAIVDEDHATVAAVLDSFRQSGVTFLMPGLDQQLDDKTVLDLSHESLMRGWQRLRGWVEVEAQSARVFRRLSDTAALWRTGKAGLFRDPDLQIALSWREQEHPNAEWAEQYGGDFDAAIGFLEQSHADVDAALRAQEAARQRELQQAQELAESRQQRLEQQQRSARKLRKMMTGLAAVAVVAGIACIAAMVANNQANTLRIMASQEAENARLNAKKAEQSALEANRLSEAAQLAERSMERTAQQAEADRIVAQRESYRSTVKLAESMLQGNEDARFGVADILWQTQPELRSWEWGYLMAQCPLEEWSLQTDATGLSSAVGTVDGRFLVTAGSGGTVALWNLESRQQVWQQATGRVHDLAVDRQGRFVGVSTADAALPQFKILELATGNLVHQSDRTGLVECAFSARGEDLYVLEQGTLRCIATSTWGQRAQAALMGLFANGHPKYNALIVDEAGKFVGVDNQFAGAGQSRFSFFDAQTLGSTTQLAGYNEVGNNLGNSSTPILNSVQGELTYSFASSVYRKTIDSERSLLCNLSDYVLYLTVDPVSGNLLSATANGEVQIVDSDGGKHSILHGAPITGLATLPHGRFVTAGADGLVKCWTLTPTESLASRIAAPVFGNASANFVDFTSDGKSLLYRTWDRHNALYQLDSLSYRHFIYPDRAGNVNLFPMIRPHTNELVDYRNDGLLFFPRNSRGTDAESTRSIPVARPISAAFDDEGRILVVSSPEESPAVFNLGSGDQIPRPQLKGSGPVAINPSGSRAAVQTRERLQVWEVATGRLLNSLEAEHNGDAGIPPDFHPEGELIAVLAHLQNSGLDRLVVWNSSVGKTQTTIESQPGVSFKSCKFSADGHRLYAVCSDDKVRILDWKLGKELIALTGGANLGSIAVSPDGLTLAYAGYNPNLFFAKSLPWEGETPRSSNFYRAVDDLRLYTVRTAQTINESIDLIEFTNHSDKPIRIEVAIPVLGPVKLGKKTLTIAPRETIPLSKVAPGTEFRFIDPKSSEQLASFTKSDIALTTDEGPVGIKVVLPGRDPMTQAAAEELQGDIAHRQGRPADAIAHYTRAVSIRTSIVRVNPSKASSQGSLAIVFLKNLAVTPGDKSDDRTALLQQAISFWQELTQHPDSKPATWQHLLRFQLQLVDHQVAIGAAESKPHVVSLLSFWSKQSKEQPANLAYGLSEVSRKLPVVYPDGVDQATLDSLMGEDPEMAGVLGDAYADQRNWAQAVALYSHGIQQNAPSLGLFAKRAMAYEQQKNWEAASADWLRAAPGNPEWSRRLVALVQRLTDSGEFALAESVRAKARVVFEEQLVKEPENSSLAGELADLLLPMGTRTLLPTSESEGGAWQFTTTQPPDDWTSEDFEDSAWKEGLGGFGAGNSQGFVRRSTWTTNDIWLRRTFEWQPVSTEHSLVLRLIHDDDVEVYFNGQQVANLPGWTPGYIDHSLDAAAVGELHAGTNTIAVHCRQYSGGQHVDAGLHVLPYGPRRLQQRFTAIKITGPWAKLAAAYYVLDDQSAVERLIHQHPIAASGIGDLLAAKLDWERAIAEYTRAIKSQTTDANLFVKRAEAYEKLERWEPAAADWGRADELLTDKTRRFQGRFSIVRRAELYDRLRQFDKALADYNRAVELPNAGLDPFVWRKDRWAKRGRWTEAADDYRQLWNKRDPSWYVEWYYSRERALLNLISGDSDGYRQAVAELLTRTENLTDSDSSTWLVYTLVAAPAAISGENLTRLTAAADRTDSSWKPRLHAAILFRRGEFQQAADLLDQHGGHPGFEFMAAMAHAKLLHPDRARQLFQLAGSWIRQQRDNDPGCGSGVPRSRWWGEWAIILQLQREAARQIDGHPLTELDAQLKAKPQDGALRLQRARRLADLGLPDEALADLAQIASAEASSVEFFSLRGRVLASLNLADEALPDLNRAIEGKTKDALVYAVRGTILGDRGQIKPARADLEKSLQLKPAEQTAGWLADLLLADNAGWTVLKATEMKSEGGATLTLQPDGSILASGTNPDQDSYKITAKPDSRGIAALRLEALPDSSLPNSGPGRDGNFLLTELEVVHQELVSQMSGTLETYAQGADFTAAQAVDSNPGTGWAIWKQEGHAHSAYFRFQSPIHVADIEPISVVLHFAANIRHTLGRFRLSVSDDPAIFEFESKRLVALKITDPWARLAVAYYIFGDQPALDKMLERHPEVAAGIGDLYAADKNWERAVAVYSKVITDATTDSPLLAKRAAAYLGAGSWELARADWRRIVAQQPVQAQAAFDVFRNAERWNEAAEFGLQLVQRKREDVLEDTLVWLRVAPVLALADDQAAYANFCDRMARQFADSDLPEVPERIVKAALLRPNSIDLAKLPADRLAKILDDKTGPDWFAPWAWCSRALWAYRSGDAESAVKFVKKSEELKPAEVAHAINLAILALAEHQLRHPDEACRALDDARQAIQLRQADPSKRDHDLLIAEILFHEAEALIAGNKP